MHNKCIVHTENSDKLEIKYKYTNITSGKIVGYGGNYLKGQLNESCILFLN